MKVEFKKIFIVAALFLVLIFASAQLGCEQTMASKQGLDFTLLSRTGFLTSGSVLHQDESFYVGVKIENYDQRERTGVVCIRDDVDEGFGGISSQGLGECQSFVVRAAEKKESKKTLLGTSSQIKPGVVEVYFPLDQEYKYFGMPEMVSPFSVNIYVSLQYNEVTQATATITSPGTEQPSVAQEPAAIKVSVLKTLYLRSQGYKLDLTINLIKQVIGSIFLPDFSKANYTQFNVNLFNTPLDCTATGKPIYGEVEVLDTKAIKCSGFIYSKQEQSIPLIVTLSYGVLLEKKFRFSIETRQR